MKKSTGLVLGGLAATGAYGANKFMEMAYFDCSQKPDPVLAEQVETLNACIKKHGSPDKNDDERFSLSFEVDSVTYDVTDGLNIFEQPILEVSFPGRIFQDECFDGAIESNRHFIRDDQKTTGDELSSWQQAQREYSSLLPKLTALCAEADHEVPQSKYHCVSPGKETLGTPAKDFRPSVVELYNSIADGICSGFFADLGGEKVVVTAAHCVVADPSCMTAEGGKGCKTAEFVHLAWPKQMDETAIQSFHYTLGIPVASFSLEKDAGFIDNSDWAVVYITPEVQASVQDVPLAPKMTSPKTGDFLLMGHGGKVTYSTVLFDQFTPESDGRLRFDGDASCRSIAGYSGGGVFDLSDNTALGILSKVNNVLDANQAYMVPVSSIQDAWTNGKLQEALAEKSPLKNLTSRYFELHASTQIEKHPAILTADGYKATVFPDADYK